MNRIDELKYLITKYDTSYRSGITLVSDEYYDSLVEELISLIGESDDFFISSIKEDIVSDRRELLPKECIMASMNKVKTIEEFQKYLKLKNIPLTTEFIISGKYDGISMLKQEDVNNTKSWTKGREDSNGNSNGGLRSENHLKFMNDVSIPLKYTFGECIISIDNFKKLLDDKNNEEEDNSARNITSGLFRKDDYTNPELLYVDFIRYGFFDDNKQFSTKQEVFDFLNQYQKIKVPYKVVKYNEITEDLLKNLFNEYSLSYILDGLIIEVNDVNLYNSLGRDRQNNPIGGIAFKSKDFDESKISKVVKIEWNISKGGQLIPVVIIEPVILGGVNVSRITANNASFLISMSANKNSVVSVVRSGAVIPLITSVLEKTPFEYPEIEGGVEWDENEVHLITKIETDEQRKKKLFSFFNILGVENVSDKTFDLLYDSGYKTVKDVLSLTKSDLVKLEGFGERKSEIVFNAINSKITDVSLSKLQHATSLFSSLGSKKLLLLEHFETKPTKEDIIHIEGFSDILANNYLEAIDSFWEFIKDLPLTWTRTKKIEPISNELEGKVFLFSGYRDKKIEHELVSKGGKIATSISKNVNFLVVKSKGSGSSKETKALELGIIILEPNELEKLIE